MVNFNQNLEAWDDNSFGGLWPMMTNAFLNCPTQPSWY